jgi:hypothetical protein
MIVKAGPVRRAEGELVDHRCGLQIDDVRVGDRAVDGVDRCVVAARRVQHVGELDDGEVPVPVEIAR